MELQITSVEDLVNFVNREDVSCEDSVIVCKVFFDADGVPYDEINTTKESVLNAIEKRLKNNLKGYPMVFCNTI